MSRRQLLLLTSLFVAFLMGGTYYALTRSGFTRAIVTDLIADVLHGVEIEGATMDPFGGTVRIEDVRVSAEEEAGSPGSGRRELLRAEEVVVGVSMNPLTGVGEVQTVTIERPVLDLRLGENESINLASLFVQQGKEPAQFDASNFPTLEVRNMVVRLHLTDNDPSPLVLEGIQLSVRREEGDDRRVAIVGSCENPFGGKIHIRGTGDIEREEFRLLSEGDPFFLGEEQIRRFGQDALDFARRHEIAGRIAPTIWMSYPSPSGGIAVGAHAKFEELTFLPPAYRYRLEQMRGRVAVSPENGGTLILECSRDGTDGKLSGRVKVTKLDSAMEVELNVLGEQMLLTPEHRVAMDPEIPPAARVWDALEPSGGRFDLRMFVFAGDGVPVEQEVIEVDLDLHGVSASYLGIREPGQKEEPVAFPLPLEDVHGKIRVRRGRVAVSDLRARCPQGGRLTGEVEFDVNTEALDLLVRGTGIGTGPELRRAFGRAVPDGLELWDQFSPQGRCDVEFRGRRTGTDSEFEFAARVMAEDARVRWTRLPVPLQHVTGEVAATRDSVRFSVAGDRAGSGPVRIRGNVDLDRNVAHREPDDERSWQVHVEAENVELDHELRNALAVLRTSFGERWDMFAPEGRADVDFLGWKSKTGELDFDLRAELRDVSARFSAFPAPMHNIDGPVLVQGGTEGIRVEVLGLRGTSLGARLLFHGSLFTPAGAEDELPLTDLTTIAQGAVLDEDLGQLLIDQKMTTRQIWDMAEASGRIDAVHRVRRGKDAQLFEQELELDMRGVRLEAEILPDHLTRVSGKLRIDKDRVAHLEELRGFLGETEIRCYEGQVEQTEQETRIQLRLGATDYPVDERLANLLDGRPKAAYLELNALGRIGFEGLSIRLRMPKTPPPGVEGLGLEVWIDEANVLVRDLSFDAGVAFSGMRGNVQLTEGHFGPAGALFRGTFSGVSFDTVGQPFESAQGDFELTHEAFTIPQGRVRLHRGTVAGVNSPNATGKVPPVFRYRMERLGPQGQLLEPRKVFADFGFQNVSIESLVEQYRLGYRYRGRVGGNLTLEMYPDDRTSLKTHGVIGVSDADLGSVPIFQSIYAFLQPEKRPRFDSVALEFATEGRAFDVRRFRIGSPLIKINGTGQIGYDGYVRMQLDFPDLFPEADEAFILPGIYKVLSNALVSFDIYGYFGMTRAGPRFLFEGSPDKVPLGPLPGQAPRIPEIYK